MAPSTEEPELALKAAASPASSAKSVGRKITVVVRNYITLMHKYTALGLKNASSSSTQREMHLEVVEDTTRLNVAEKEYRRHQFNRSDRLVSPVEVGPKMVATVSQ